jgi:hypothetical protein
VYRAQHGTKDTAQYARNDRCPRNPGDEKMNAGARDYAHEQKEEDVERPHAVLFLTRAI